MMKRIFAGGLAMVAVALCATVSFAAEAAPMPPGYDLTPAFTLDQVPVDLASIAAPEVVAMVEVVQIGATPVHGSGLSAGRMIAGLPASMSDMGRAGRMIDNVAYHLLI